MGRQHGLVNTATAVNDRRSNSTIPEVSQAKKQFGLEGLLLGKAQVEAPPPERRASATPRNVSQYKLKCPQCQSGLAFEEGCVKCYGCGYSQC